MLMESPLLLSPSISPVPGKNDLLIVGPGVLGRLVAERWRQEYQNCYIYGQTLTKDHHKELTTLGIHPSLSWTDTPHKYPNIIFCAPPSNASSYPEEVRNSILSWNGEGSFLFTSSSSVFECSDNGPCYEESAVIPIGRNPRIDILLKSENIALGYGGCVVRLAGLYKVDRGAHTYWLEKGTVVADPDHLLNLIHYEDAASLAVAIMKKRMRGRIFLGCDNHPLTRQEMMDLVAKCGKFHKKFRGFTGTGGPLGKKLNNTRTRDEVGWTPRYPSFAIFLGALD